MTLKKLGIYIASVALLVSSLSGCAADQNAASTEETTVDQTQEASTEAIEESEAVTEPSEAELTFNTYFVSSEWLNDNMDSVIVLDARGQETYDKGHVPGARVLTWQSLSRTDVEFASETWGTLKDADALGQAISELGLSADSEVVVYSDTQNGWGEDGRIMWTLQAAGIENVRMLDGGYKGWKDAGYDITKETSEFEATDFVVEELDLVESISTAKLVENYDDYKVIDTRDKDEYEGAQKFGEARGGHLPSAVWMAYKDLLEKDGTLKPINELEAIFADAGFEKTDKIATYCTAGIRSAHYAEILKMLGYENVVNYDASFYVWANTPELQIGKVVKDHAYNYYAPDHVKSALENNEEIMLLDIQPEEDFDAHHIKGAVETNAYPVKSDEDKAKLEDVLATINGSNEDVVIVCPRGGGGAERTYQELEANGIDTSRLFILEGGQADWPFAELVN
ncbi:rhodanese-like domain-containing protein [Fusibacter sp. JL216-2]|uniref:rhodanese-like domain-containing protein n=1 Tax=Fusibacter sp. JL216-2 TaxID=3071453 RepID=UPI003D32701D